jgi:hypothetical protein
MTSKEMLDELKRMYKEDGDLNEEACILDLLDYLGIMGVPGGSDCYFYMLRKTTEEHPT